MALKQIGVEAVVKGLDAYERGMKLIQEASRQTVERITQATEKAGKSSEKIISPIETLTNKVKDFAKSALEGIPVIGDYADVITEMLNPAALAAVAIAALTVAIVGLGIQGGKIKGVRDSFAALTAVYASANDALDRLREATRGTVTDFELMRVTNVALAGASQTFAKQFGEALPQVFEIARLQAQATGQDVGYLVNSLVTGIKRASPLLIDNTGIVLKVGEANDKLAQKLGKSVEALTAEEKQIAVLNAVLDAGKNITAQYADAQEYASVKALRAQTTIQNAIAAVQVAVEPIAASVLDAVNLVLDNLGKIGAGFMTILQPIINVIASIVRAITSILAPVINFIGSTIGDVFSLIGSVVETVLAPFQILIEILGKVGGAVVSFVVTPFRGLLDFLVKAIGFIVGLARGFLKAGAALIGALSAGILHAANETLVPVVVAVATLIADFLVGHSPPPKGPLSEIDKGGAATMEAWIGGFAGVSLDPVSEVAAGVTAAMGSIAQMSIDGVKQRIKQLDAALQPFQDRLNIVKAQFEAFKPVTDAAFNAIDRQLDTAVQALANGGQNAAEQVRLLDTQRQSLQDYVDAQQQAIDNAQIQYALAQAQQARERVLLSIRERQLDIDKEKDPVVKAAKEKALKDDKEKAGKGGETPATAGGAGGFDVPKAPGENGFVDELKGAFSTAFEQGGGPQELSKLEQGGKLISAQFDRIGSAFDNSPIVKGFKNIADSVSAMFDANNPDSFLFKVIQALAYHSNPSNADGIVGWFVNLPAAIANATNGLGDRIKVSVVEPMIRGFLTAFDPSNPDSLPSQLDLFFKGDGKLYQILSAPITWLQTNVIEPFNTKFGEIYTGLFDTTNADSFAAKAWEFMAGTGEGSLFWIFTAPVRWFTKEVINPLGDLFYSLWDGLINPDNPDSFGGKAKHFWFDDGEGTLKGIINSFGNFVKAAIANPFIAGFNSVIGAIESFVNGTIIKAMNDLASIFYSLIDAVGQGGSEVGQKLKAFSSMQVSFGRLPLLAKGGLMSSGMFEAGERGREIGMSAKPFAMFSNRFVKAIDLFADTVAKPMPLPVTAGSTYNNTNSNESMTNNFYGVPGSDDAVRRIALMRAFK